MKKTTSPRSEPKQIERHVVGGFIQLTPLTAEQRTTRPAPLAPRPGGRPARGVCASCGAEAVVRLPIMYRNKALQETYPVVRGTRLCATCSWLLPARLEVLVGIRHAKRIERFGD